MFSKRGTKLSFRSRLPPAPLACPAAVAKDGFSLREGERPSGHQRAGAVTLDGSATNVKVWSEYLSRVTARSVNVECESCMRLFCVASVNAQGAPVGQVHEPTSSGRHIWKPLMPKALSLVLLGGTQITPVVVAKKLVRTLATSSSPAGRRRRSSHTASSCQHRPQQGLGSPGRCGTCCLFL